MLLKNGEEQNFSNAISNATIKLRSLDELLQVLRLVMLKVGIRAENLPSQDERAVLIAHILSEYGNHTIEEIKLAFDMAITSKLELEQKEVVCYENFSCLYFSKIMNAYRLWSKQVHSFLINKPMVMIEDKTELTESDIQEWLEDWISKDRYDMELLPLCFYDHLVKTGRLVISAKQKWEYTEKATTAIKVKLQEDLGICKTNDAYIAFNKFENMEVNGFEGEMKGRILNMAKRLIIRDYITSVKNV